MSEFYAMTTPGTDRVLVACPDARPPAYQAVIGLAQANLLHSFHTAYYYGGGGRLGSLARRVAPERFARWQRTLSRRHDPEIPRARVRSSWGYDVALRLEDRLARRGHRARSGVARWRTEQYDRKLARALTRHRPDAALLFSDVGSHYSLPICRELGIGSILSMVHGDVREEQQVLEREAEAAPDFFRIYLGDGSLDLAALAWLHERRLRDIELADRILVPSDHIADTLVRYGTSRDKIAVIPYAADTRRFRPDPAKRHDETCTFLFAGGITQRKGIKYLLEAWRRVRRPGWRLQLLGELPSDPGPLVDYLDGVEVLGRVAHAEVPARMSAADVFVFPSLFEGSAVVTYEALASGLACVVTPDAGSVVRDGIEGLLIPPATVGRLAEAMESLGNDPDRRAAMAAAARTRAESFDWPRYHRAVAETARLAVGCPA
jgi:starch synthase